MRKPHCDLNQVEQDVFVDRRQERRAATDDDRILEHAQLVVFSRTLDGVRGNARLAEAPLAEEIAAAIDMTDKDVSIGGAGLAAAAIELGLVDELRMFRYPVVVGGGTPYLPPVTEDVRLDLIETRTFDSRVIYERYRRVGVPWSS